jgi:hypothetical protein
MQWYKNSKCCCFHPLPSQPLSTSLALCQAISQGQQGDLRETEWIQEATRQAEQGKQEQEESRQVQEYQ